MKVRARVARVITFDPSNYAKRCGKLEQLSIASWLAFASKMQDTVGSLTLL